MISGTEQEIAIHFNKSTSSSRDSGKLEDVLSVRENKARQIKIINSYIPLMPHPSQSGVFSLVIRTRGNTLGMNSLEDISF